MIKVPLFTDNYCYILVDRVTKQAAVVDPGTSSPVISALEELQLEKGINLTTILCTHKHDDHVGGNAAMKKHFPNIEIVGTGYEDLPSLDRPVYHNDIYSFGGLDVLTIHTPCHTSGHVCFFVSPSSLSNNELGDMSPILFSGDTLFAGGCGRFFEGTGTYESSLYRNIIFYSVPMVQQYNNGGLMSAFALPRRARYASQHGPAGCSAPSHAGLLRTRVHS